jgi:hypothetical protein
LSIAAVARPETTIPTCSIEQLDAPEAGPTWNHLELALLESSNFVGLLEPLQRHIHVSSHL